MAPGTEAVGCRTLRYWNVIYLIAIYLAHIGFPGHSNSTRLHAQDSTSEIPGWGHFVDPSQTSRVKADDDAITITSANNKMTVEDTLGKLPRVVRDVNGNFDVRVHVSGNFKPKQKAVLLAYTNPRKYLRVTTGLGLYPASKELSTEIVIAGDLVKSRQDRPQQTSMWLRVRRVNGELSSYYSPDGEEWYDSASSNDVELDNGAKVSFREPMQVMFLIHNQRRNSLAVRFEQLDLREGPAVQPIEVTEHPKAKAIRLQKEAEAKRFKTLCWGLVFATATVLGWLVFFTGMWDGRTFRFSVRRLFGLVTLIAASLGVTMLFVSAADGPTEAFAIVATVSLATLTGMAIYAAGDPWLGCPAMPVALPQTAGNSNGMGLVMHILAVLMGGVFLLIGGLASMLIIEDNWTMDTGGASREEWLLGIPFFVLTAIGSFARGASLVGVIGLVFGVSLGRGFTNYFSLGLGSFLALLLWVPLHEFGASFGTEDYGMRQARGNLATGGIGLALLLVCWLVTFLSNRRGAVFGRRSRRLAGRFYLLGLVIGGVVALVPFATWLLFGPAVSIFFGGMIGASLGVLTGILIGSTVPTTSESSSEPNKPVTNKPDTNKRNTNK